MLSGMLSAPHVTTYFILNVWENKSATRKKWQKSSCVSSASQKSLPSQSTRDLPVLTTKYDSFVTISDIQTHLDFITMGCKFKLEWLEEECYAEWLAPDPKNTGNAICDICKKVLNISTMGTSGLTSHMNTKKHLKRMELKKKNMTLDSVVTSVRRSVGESSTAPSTSQNQTATSSTLIMDTVHSKDVKTAELWYALHCVNSGYSFNSCTDISFIVRQMFIDSKIAKQFTFGETKFMYTVVYGLAPYFKRLLDQKVKGQPYVIMFDESPNKKLKTKQMDVLVRFWDGNCIKSRYLDSRFLGHATAADLLEHLTPVIEPLGMHNMLQLSMDGPNVNWALWDRVGDVLQDEHHGKSLLNIGSCGLHILHNSFRAGMCI